MATPKTVWGIDIGQCNLKALKLRDVEGELRVEAFDIIEHPKILSQPDADRRQLIQNALEQFLARNNVIGSTIVVSVPGQTSFTRFVKLPPVESKRVPEIVKFEAEQQIPFPINDVIWRWQTFQDPDSPDVEVGIFAMKKVDVAEVLSHFAGVELGVDMVQMAPLALYNFMVFDEQRTAEGATLLADVGADKTDLVLADGAKIWTRTIQIGGNNFTEALVRAFKLSFAKAEKLKRTAATSKYARQIFQAMRPVFADLVQEIQRSIGYYTSLHRETRFKKLVGLGNGFRLPGLQKFLEQNLNIPVVRIDSYNKLTPSPTVNAPTFTENVLSFAVAYGLALQGLELTAVSTNLLPTEVAKKRLWKSKRPMFIAASLVVVAMFCIPLARSFIDLGEYKPFLDYNDANAEAQRIARLKLDLSAQPQIVQTLILTDEMQKWVDEYDKLAKQGNEEKHLIESYLKLYAYREYWPAAMNVISQAVDAAAEDQRLLNAYAVAATDVDRQKVMDKIKERKDSGKTDRQARKMLFIDTIAPKYVRNVYEKKAQPQGAAAPAPAQPYGAAAAPVTAKPGFVITITGHTPMTQGDTSARLYKMLQQAHAFAANTKMLTVVPKDDSLANSSDVIKLPPYSDVAKAFTAIGGGSMAPAAPSGVAAGEATQKIQFPDPLFPDEDMAKDTGFEVRLTITIDSDGLNIAK